MELNQVSSELNLKSINNVSSLVSMSELLKLIEQSLQDELEAFLWRRFAVEE